MVKTHIGSAYRKGKTYLEIYGKEKADNIKSKMSNARIGKESYWKGKKKGSYSEEHRKKISNSLIGFKQSGEHRKKNSLVHLGHIAWNKGLKGCNLGHEVSLETRRKISEKQKGKITPTYRRIMISNTLKSKYKKGEMVSPLTIMRKNGTLVMPIKDTTIEIKMQELLTKLGIEFHTHQYIKEIDHGYQCDIMIPIQKGITKKTIIECFGTYWHRPYPIGREIDMLRINELREKGWRVLVFWENEIKLMELDNIQEVISR